MGLDLTLMPLKNARELAGHILGYNRFQFVRDYKIFAQIADVEGKSAVPDEGVEAIVKTHPLPPGVKVGIYGDSGIRNTRKNPYEEEMVYAVIMPGRFLDIFPFGNIALKSRPHFIRRN